MKKQLILLLIISSLTWGALPPEYRLQRDNNAKSGFIEAHPLIKKNLINEKKVTYYFPTPYGDKTCQVKFTRNYPKAKQTTDANGRVITQPRPSGPAPDLTFKSSNCPTKFTALNKHLSECRHRKAIPWHGLGSSKNDYEVSTPICKRPELTTKLLERRLTTLLNKTLASELSAKVLKHSTAFYDLNGDGLKDAIVHLQSRKFCGSGGCDTHVYQLDIVNGKPKFQSISRIGLSKTPIYVLETQTNGWHDIGVYISGGGIEPQNVALRFNHKKYNYAKGHPRSVQNGKFIGYPTNPTSTKYGNYIQKILGKPKGVLVIR